MNNDTICALATAPGGALGIIRVSGSEALAIVSSICSIHCETVQANTVRFARLIVPETSATPRTEGPTVPETAAKPRTEGPTVPLSSATPRTEGPTVPYTATLSQSETVIDEALITVFHAPHSYTGEDSVEISCHGSRYILNKVLQLLCQQGCRMAGPGEFTQRAFLNGKMDLSQAEAVADLIAAGSRATHQIAMSQLRGRYCTELTRLREQLLKLTSLLELELDFSDHEDLEFADRGELTALAREIDDRLMQMVRSFETGQALKEGIAVAIVGKTNVGKSTLLNRLLHEDRAIVSDIHGTTRDTIEDTKDINGVTFRFIDTAGIRTTDDRVEQIGIERTYAAIDRARIVVWMIDEGTTRDEIEEMSRLTMNKETIIVYNKVDTIERQRFMPPFVPLLCISAKRGDNVERLEQMIYRAAKIPELTDGDVIVTSARQYDALQRASINILRVLDALEAGESGDLVAEDLRMALHELAEITGDGLITPEETLNNIFSHFCVGK